MSASVHRIITRKEIRRRELRAAAIGALVGSIGGRALWELTLWLVS